MMGRKVFAPNFKGLQLRSYILLRFKILSIAPPLILTVVNYDQIRTQLCLQ